MQISVFNAFATNKSNNVNNIKNSSSPIGLNKFKSQGDQFVKSKQISFTSSSGVPKKSSMSNVSDDLLAIGIAGGPLLLVLGTSILMCKKANSMNHDTFLSDKSSIVNKTAQTLNSEHLTADGKTGAVKIEGTGIDLDPKRFEYVDPKHGVYENSEKGIYIDLLHNKYIDPEKGIILDPDHKNTVAIIDGKPVQLEIPMFKGNQIGGGQEPGNLLELGDTYYYGKTDEPLTREEYFAQFGKYPE